MRRKAFICRAAGALALPLAWSCSRRGPYPDSRRLVSTEANRKAYLGDMLKKLCSEIGPHPVGSPEYDRAARVVKEEMEKALPEVFLDTFEFDRWVLTGEPEFFIGDRKLETYPCHGTSGTGPQGVTGVLHRIQDEGDIPFAIFDPDTDEQLAFVTLSRFGLAVPLPYYSFKRPVKCPPIFNIVLQDQRLLEAAVSNGTIVRAVSTVEFRPGTKTANVVGSIPGQSREEMIFLAHLDTVYSSPGANDNTASVIAMLMIAHAYSAARNDKRLTFVATTGEEYGKLGAINYAERRKAEGTFEQIKYLVNLDSITWGPDMKVNTEDDELMRMISQIDEEQRIPGAPRWEGTDGFMLDGEPFRSGEIRAVYINSDGYQLQSLWHRPEDTAEMVPADCVEIWFRLFKEYVRRIMGI